MTKNRTDNNSNASIKEYMKVTDPRTESAVHEYNKKIERLVVANITMDVFLFLLIYELKENLKDRDVKIFSCDTFLMMMDIEQPLSQKKALVYFLILQIAIQDVVICPIYYRAHVTMIFAFKNLQKIIYTDTMGNVSSKHIAHFVNMYWSYFAYHGVPFRLGDWKVFAPSDVPRQVTKNEITNTYVANSYDCAILSALFSEVLIYEDISIFHRYYPDRVAEYRATIRNRIIDASNRNFESALFREEEDVDMDIKRAKQIQTDTIKENDLLIQTCPPEPGRTTMEFLASALNSYWDEEASICHMKSECLDPRQKTLYQCVVCNHWFHLRCQKVAITKTRPEPKHFVCNECKKM